MRTYLHGIMTWEIMQTSTWKDIANWRMKPRSNRIKFQLHDLMTVNSKKKNGDLWRIVKSLLSNRRKVSVLGTHR